MSVRRLFTALRTAFAWAAFALALMAGVAVMTVGCAIAMTWQELGRIFLVGLALLGLAAAIYTDHQNRKDL